MKKKNENFPGFVWIMSIKNGDFLLRTSLEENDLLAYLSTHVEFARNKMKI